MTKSKNNLILKPGEKLTISGRNGSGKTQFADFIVRRADGYWIILDQKHDDTLEKLAKPVTSFKDVENWLKKPNSKFCVFRPKTSDPEIIDEWIFDLSERSKNIGLYIDELYYVMRNGQAGRGLQGWLTRGRSRKQSFIGITQRPKRVSLFCFSEADFIAQFFLTLVDDRQRIYEFIGRDIVKENPPLRYSFRYYDVKRDELTTFGPITIRK